MDAEKKKISLKEKQDEGRPASKEAEKKPASKAADSRKVDPKKAKKKKPNIFQRIGRFFKDSWGELKKVTWPTRKEWIAYSIAVLVFILVLTIVVGAFDYLMSLILQLIIK